MHSMSGGTGSGVGSALLGHVRDYYPSSWLMPVSIGAFARGDTPLQVKHGYNYGCATVGTMGVVKYSFF